MSLKWLQCLIGHGQFNGEYAVKGELFDGNAFSLFAARDELEIVTEPNDVEVAGFVQIKPLESKEGNVLVALPRETFENGRIITVKKTQLK